MTAPLDIGIRIDPAQPISPDYPPPPPSDMKRSDAYYWYQDQMIGVLNEVRTIALELARYVALVVATDQSMDEQARAREIVATTSEAEIALSKDAPEIARALATLRHLITQDPAVAMRYAGRIERVRVAWDRALQSWSYRRAWQLSADPLTAEQRSKADTMLKVMRAVSTDLAAMVDETAEITVPFRLQEVLEAAPIGSAVEFNKVFRIDLPNPEKRKAVLTELAENPPWALPGVADPERGLITKISLSPLRRARSWLVPLVLAELPLVPLLILGVSFVPGAVDATANVAAVAYLVVLAGAIAHVILQALRESRSSQGSRFKSTDNIGLWIHMNEIPLIFGVISLWVAFAALATVVKSFDLLTAFVAGYSADTFVDLFLSRFDTKVAAVTGANTPARS